jgi:hypothetical protein
MQRQVHVIDELLQFIQERFQVGASQSGMGASHLGVGAKGENHPGLGVSGC